MIQAVRLGSVVVVLILASVLVACAECAWVLWAGEWFDAGLDRPPSVVQAVATRPDCLAAMERTAQAFKQSMRGDADIRRDPVRDPWALVVLGTGHTVTLRCLPDTIDPRWPTMKKRPG